MSVAERLLAFYADELPTRADRPVGAERAARLAGFIDRCRAESLGSVLEVGCGAGRDGVSLLQAGIAYTGVDLSPVGVRLCRERGLTATVASAVALPFDDHQFDAAWTMSTLMHLEGRAMDDAVGELGRVVARGGVVDLGVWGARTSGVWTDRHGRHFQHRDDEGFRALASTIGDVESFDTWDWSADGVHYQYARVRVG